MGPPAGLSVASGDDQQGTVGAPVPIPPSVRVRDANGRGVAGISVKFDVISGGGAVTGDSVVTDSEGLATVGEWRLGPLPVANTLRAQTIDHPYQITIDAVASPGAPSSLQVVSGGANLAAVVGQEVIPRPTVRVRDAFGNPIPNTPVTWTVIAGGGSIVGPSTTLTDAEGRTSVGGWKMGPASGINQLRARTANGIVATFSANGIGVPQALIPESPTNQAGFINFAVPKTARVRVVDELNSNIVGLPVVFTHTSGTGTIIGDTVVTDANGIAALGDWKLGATGFSQVTATVPGFSGPSAVFTATGVAKAFTIDVRFLNTPPADLRDAFIAGAMRWMEVIVGDLPDFNLSRAASACLGDINLPALNETIDDLIIYARIGPIDGPSQILAQAGTCSNGGERPVSLLTALGAMDFDVDDAQLLLNTGRFVAVVTHEMGHVLGMIDRRYTARGVEADINGTDPRFIGPQALAAWPTLQINYAGLPIPLENAFGAGTNKHHWRESVLTSELMTGIIENQGVPMPLTAITVAAMADLGYVVNMSAAETYIPNLLALPGGAGRIVLGEQLYRNGVKIE